MNRWLAGALLVAACGAPRPAAFHYGEDLCAHCHMTVADPSYAAQLVTTTGKVYRFDDIGCLAEFENGGTVEPEMIHSRWVNRFLSPDSMLIAEEAVFLHSPSLHSPMGHGLAALDPAAADSVRRELGGALYRWDDVLAGRYRSVEESGG